MRRERSLPVALTACALALGLLAGPVARAAEQARPKSDSRAEPRAAGREAPRGEDEAGLKVSAALDRKHVRAGDTVRLTVSIARAENVAHVPFHLGFDPSVLRFEGSDEGEFLNSDGVGTVFLASPAGAGSSVVVGLSRLGRESGVAGHGTLCTLRFTAIGPGDAQLAFSRASVRDPENRALDAEFTAPRLVVR